MSSQPSQKHRLISPICLSVVVDVTSIIILPDFIVLHSCRPSGNNTFNLCYFYAILNFATFFWQAWLKEPNKREFIINILYSMYCQDQISSCNIKLILINQADGSTKQFPFMVPFIPASRDIRLNEALNDTCHRIMPLYGAQLFQVDFVNRMHRFLGIYPIEREIRISYQSVVNNTIQIHVRPESRDNPSFTDIKQEEPANSVQGPKTKKVKERTIQEAVESVKLWRKLYDTDDGNGKRLYTLDDAAKLVGIAKKTLDDYYSLIRMAMNFNFNLDKYKQCKVGLLRKFVKIAKEEGEEGVNAKMYQYLYDVNIQKFWISLDDL